MIPLQQAMRMMADAKHHLFDSKTKRNCQWSQNAVCRILTNKLYNEKIIDGKQKVADFLTERRTDKPADDWLVADGLSHLEKAPSQVEI